jgi:hypothetical protein
MAFARPALAFAGDENGQNGVEKGVVWFSKFSLGLSLSPDAPSITPCTVSDGPQVTLGMPPKSLGMLPKSLGIPSKSLGICSKPLEICPKLLEVLPKLLGKPSKWRADRPKGILGGFGGRVKIWDGLLVTTPPRV